MKKIFLIVTIVMSCVAVSTATQTYIPTMYVKCSGINSDSYVVGNLTYDSLTANGAVTLSYAVKVKYRGSTEREKRSFLLKFVDSSEAKKNVSFFDMRTDNAWVLDAMATDHARMRSVLSEQLWLDFSSKPYWADEQSTLVNGSRGAFVELYLNGEYNGVYCLKERIDRKQLDLKKIKNDGTIRGMLFKADEVTETTQMLTAETYNSASDIWNGFEAVYPELGDQVSSVTWSPLYDLVRFVYNSNDATFQSNVAKYFDFSVLVDYYIFINLIGAQDNTTKDIYYSVVNKNVLEKYSITPWNLDHSWGRMGSTEKFSAWKTVEWDNQLFARLQSYETFTNAVIARYKALRETYFQQANLISRIEKLFDLLNDSGAFAREQKKWATTNIPLDLETEKEFIEKWITTRLIAVDNLIINGDGLEQSTVAEFEIRSCNDGICLKSESCMNVSIYDISGRELIQTRLNEGEERTINVSRGMYILRTPTETLKIIVR